MFTMHPQIAPARVTGLLKAAEAAARAIPPAFPLTATVAVNPFMGQAGQDLATAAARMARVAGIRLTSERSFYAAKLSAGDMTDEDLAKALEAANAPLKPKHLAALKAELAQERPPRAGAADGGRTCGEGGRQRLALRHRAELRAVGGGAFRPWPGAVVASTGAERICRLAGMGGA